jgi:hypothetical protein
VATKRFGEIDDFGRGRGLGIVYEVTYASGTKKYIAPYMKKDGKTRDAMSRTSVEAVRSGIASAGGRELDDADLNVAWAVKWLNTYGGMSKEVVSSSKAIVVPVVAAPVAVAPVVVPATVVVATPVSSPGVTVVQDVPTPTAQELVNGKPTLNWWDQMWADIAKAFGIK